MFYVLCVSSFTTLDGQQRKNPETGVKNVENIEPHQPAYSSSQIVYLWMTFTNLREHRAPPLTRPPYAVMWLCLQIGKLIHAIAHGGCTCGSWLREIKSLAAPGTRTNVSTGPGFLDGRSTNWTTGPPIVCYYAVFSFFLFSSCHLLLFVFFLTGNSAADAFGDL